MSTSRLACPLFLVTLAMPGLAQAPVRILSGGDYGTTRFGQSIAGVGDVDGDGHDDVAVGVPLEFVTAAAHGRVRVISGFDGTELHRFDGFGFWSYFGQSIAAAGDVDRDGVPDILVGAPGDDFTGTQAGAAWLFSGRDGSLLFLLVGHGSGAEFGTAVAGAGDVNGDAFPDLVVGAPGLGYVDVLSGRNGGLLYRVQGAGPNTRFGASVSGAGDLDGDGLGDIVVGEPSAGPTGAVHAFMGPGGSRTKTVVPASAVAFGRAISRMGDVNGDGRTEIVIGSKTNTSFVSSLAFVWDASTNVLIFEVGHPTTSHGTGFGETVAGPGDMDADGVPDFVVGAYSDPVNGSGAGAAYLFSGRDGSLLWRILNVGDPICDRFGTCVSAAGDVNGDGHPDVAVGAPFDFAPWPPCHGTGLGSVLVFSLRCPSALSYCTSKVNSQGCAPAMSAVGTPSASGPDDFVVSARGVINQKSGLLIWSLVRSVAPFQGDTLCVGAPIVRTPVQTSGGNPPPDDCSGSFSFQFTQTYLSEKGLGPGARLFAQFWYRDPASSGGSGLTDALDWVVCY